MAPPHSPHSQFPDFSGKRGDIDEAELEAMLEELHRESESSDAGPPRGSDTYTGPTSGGLPRPGQPEPRLTEGDLCDRYVDTHQRTLYALGRFWRCPSRRRWEPVPDALISREVYDTLVSEQENGPAPTPARVASVINLLRLRLDELEPGAFDNPAGFIPLPTRLFELATGEYTLLEPDHYVATTLPHDLDYEAQAPHWQRFLQSTLPAAADFIQEFAGYCLTTDTHLEQSLWLYGPPMCGKSTLLHGLQTLLGPRAGVLPLADLARRQLDPALLHGKTLLVSHEPPADLAAVGLLSALVSGEPLSVQRAHRASITLHTRAKLALTFQTLPSLDTRYASLYHRAALVVFPPLAPAARDPFLKERLAAEGPGLLLWAMRGLSRLYRRGRFDPPATMLAASQRLQLAQTTPATFLAERCQISPTQRAQAVDLHQAYVAWCHGLGLQPVTAKALAAEWQRHGLERRRIAGKSYWYGLTLLPETPAPTLPLPALGPIAPG